MSHHGMNGLARLVMAGAAFAEGEMFTRRAQNGDGGASPPGMPDVETCPRWSKSFARLLDRYHEACQSEAPLEAVTQFLSGSVVPILERGAAAAEGNEVFDVDAGEHARWDALFGWAGIEHARVAGLKGLGLLPILCCIFARAAALRWNRFGRILPAAGTAPSRSALDALAGSMNEGFGVPTSGVPLGFVFLGQFIDHDITLDATSSLTDDAFDLEEIVNLRSPALDLDSVYGDGPEGSPYLYDQVRRTQAREVGYLLLSSDGRDLPRNRQGRALIGDPRNDENLFVSQLHLQFLLFHNAVLRLVETGTVDTAFGRGTDEHDAFEFVRRLVRWHYQWLLVEEYLPSLVDAEPLQAAHAITGVPRGGSVPTLPSGYATARDRLWGLDFIDCCGRRCSGPLMPVEFSGAAFRFAHSQVPSRLDVNAERLDVPIFAPRPPAPGAFRPAVDVVEWPRFFEIDGSTPQRARRIDTFVAAQLFSLPFVTDGVGSLPLRNLVRSAQTYRIPTGEVARAQLGLTSSQMSSVAQAKAAAAGLGGETPLWFYCLGEAEHFGGKLGPVGGLMVAWTLLRQLECDARSYVHAPSWRPVLNTSTPGEFGIADLIRIAQGERRDSAPTS